MKNLGYSDSVDFRNLRVNGIEVSEIRWSSKEEAETFNFAKLERGEKYIYIVFGSSCSYFAISSSVKLTEVIEGRKTLSDNLLKELYNNKSGISYK